VVVLLLFLSILPVFLLARYIYNNDFEKEPTSLLVGLFLMGIGSVIVTYFLSSFLENTFPFFSPQNQIYLNVLELIPYVYIGVALIEEFAKWIFVYLYAYHHYEFNHAYDAIVYCVFVSMGFACIENLLYVFNYGSMQTAIVRGITAVPGHACFGILMGFYFGMAKTADKLRNKGVSHKNKVKSLLLPVLAHGTYDYLIFGSVHVSFFTILFIAFIVFLFSQTADKVKQLAKIHFDIRESIPSMSNQYSYHYCPMCGEKVVGHFCIKCGFEHTTVK